MTTLSPSLMPPDEPHGDHYFNTPNKVHGRVPACAGSPPLAGYAFNGPLSDEWMETATHGRLWVVRKHLPVRGRPECDCAAYRGDPRVVAANHRVWAMYDGDPGVVAAGYARVVESGPEGGDGRDSVRTLVCAPEIAGYYEARDCDGRLWWVDVDRRRLRFTSRWRDWIAAEA